ncbi:MAG: STAS domain-containing protein [Planctomycetota bacterium]|nr:STAS domain-containing protein [Planctomycetota bacterium]
MSESVNNCIVMENSNRQLEVKFRNPDAFTPEFVPETATELYSILNSATSDIRLNLSGIDFISSAAINMLLEIRHHGVEKGVSFSLGQVEPVVREVLRVMQLERLFECESCGV